jgi:hypothetical protein
MWHTCLYEWNLEYYMCEYDGWAYFIRVNAYRWEILASNKGGF